MNFLILAALIQVASASSFAAKTLFKKAAKAASVATFATAFKGIERSECVPERPGFFEDWRGVAKCSPISASFNFNQVSENPAYFLVALHQGNVEAMKNYLKNGVDPNVLDCDRNDFFYYAFKHNLPVEVIQMAIKNGLNINEIEPISGALPLDRAIDGMHYEIAEVLIQKGAFSMRNANEIIMQIVEECQEDVTDLSPFILILSIFESNKRNARLLTEAIDVANAQGKREFSAFLSALAREAF